MSDEMAGQPDGSHEQPRQPAPHTQEVRHMPVSALVPERVARGAFSTGAVVLNGAYEFVIDFLVRMSKPHQVAARVVLPPGVVPRFIAALEENLKNYIQRYGEPVMPQPKARSTEADGSAPQQQQSSSPAQQAPGTMVTNVGAGQTGSSSSSTSAGGVQQLPPQSAQELYDELKIPDEELSGVYANAVMIGHTPTEFCFDFITTFFPKSAVSKRVYMAAPNVPRLLESLKHSFEQYQRRLEAARRQAPPPPSGPPSSDVPPPSSPSSPPEGPEEL